MSRIAEISSKSRESILASLDKSHKKDLFYEKITDPAKFIKTSDDDLAEMKQKMEANKYVVEESSKENLEEKINEIIAKYDFKKMLYGKGLSLNLDKIKAESKICFCEEIENLRKEVFDSDFAIVEARVGVSSHGVALITSSKDQPRMLSLAPKLCIVLLKKENVVKSLSEALNLVKSENEILPSNILFIAGPSRTADIELITIFGVHGPQLAHIVIY